MTEQAAVGPGWRYLRFPQLLRGRPIREAAVERSPRWARVSLALLLLATAGLYLWGLGASGWGNSFYSAAVEAATKSWKAFLFGSFDASNFITVDKPPASLWVMDISARIFGVNTWSILVPQALEGVAAVALLYATVRRHFGHAAGLIAGAVLAVTPVATLMFRFNNPDPLLVLLLVGAAYAMTRALQSGATRWLVLAGSLVGFGFLTKMLQAFVVLPVFVLVYVLAAPVPMRKRALQLLLAGAAVVVSAGWWVALVALWPAADRPYIGGSTDNSIFNLIFGYNGFGRITGNETGSVGGGGPSGWGPTGWDRMFNANFGGQISWLIPAALISFGALLFTRWRAQRTDGKRAVVLMWGGWLVLTGTVFSLAQGIIHPYYTVALAPAIGALVGMGAVTFWRNRERVFSREVLAAAVLATATWSFVLLGRSPGWMPWLAGVLLALGILSAGAVLALPFLRRVLIAPVAALSLATLLAGSVAYSIDTAVTPHSGAIPSAGPAVVSSFGGPGGPRDGVNRGGALPFRGAGGAFAGGFGLPPFAGGGGAFAGGFGPPPSTARSSGGLLDAGSPPAAVVRALQTDSSIYSWAAAAVGANNAAGYQLATGDAVMAIGGFNGTDPTPTLAQFEQLVSQGKIHYFIGGGGMGRGPGAGTSTSSSAITSWVEQHFAATTIGGTTLYDLTSPIA